MKARKFLFRSALLLLLAGAVAFAPAAWAEDEGAPPDDLKAKVKKKLEKVLELMRQNEVALLKLSTGGAAAPKRVDLEPPPQNGGESSGGESSGSAAGGDSNGAGPSSEEISRKLDELIKGQQGASGPIPDELKQVVKMIPL
jgi:hypothetical protein